MTVESVEIDMFCIPAMAPWKINQLLDFDAIIRTKTVVLQSCPLPVSGFHEDREEEISIVQSAGVLDARVPFPM
jgi:hypothetical protein